uniref:Uncharacterized protein n=1 Tax=Panagrolaimus sp. ES5 TaxID=591445 RepID=A0AC34G0T9_9BILA
MKFWKIETEFDPISLCKFLKENLDADSNLVFSFAFASRQLELQLLPRENLDADSNLVFSFAFASHQLELQLLPRVKKLINAWETNKPKYLF